MNTLITAKTIPTATFLLANTPVFTHIGQRIRLLSFVELQARIGGERLGDLKQFHQLLGLVTDEECSKQAEILVIAAAIKVLCTCVLNSLVILLFFFFFSVLFYYTLSLVLFG